MTDLPDTNLTMLTLVKPEGELEVSLERRPMPTPKSHEVLVKILATPINPSDLGLLFGGADMSTARASTRDGLPVITADIPPAGMRAMVGRIGEALAIGNEGCGTVVAAGDSARGAGAAGQDRRADRRRNLCRVSLSARADVHGLARRHRSEGRRVVFRQSADQPWPSPKR